MTRTLTPGWTSVSVFACIPAPIRISYSISVSCPTTPTSTVVTHPTTTVTTPTPVATSTPHLVRHGNTNTKSSPLTIEIALIVLTIAMVLVAGVLYHKRGYTCRGSPRGALANPRESSNYHQLGVVQDGEGWANGAEEGDDDDDDDVELINESLYFSCSETPAPEIEL
jgi:hypothetical protein